MLTVQPVNFKQTFKGGYTAAIPYGSEAARSPMQDEWEGYKSEFENLAADDNLPKPIRRFARFMKIMSGGVVTALGVIWASKKAGNLSKSAYNSEFVQNSINRGKSLFEKAENPLKKLGKKIKLKTFRSFIKFKNTKFGQKVIENYTKLKNSKFGKAVKYITDKIKDGWKFVKNTFTNAKKDLTFEKVNDTTANVMGTGAGVATAYDIARGDTQQEIPFEEVEK